MLLNPEIDENKTLDMIWFFGHFLWEISGDFRIWVDSYKGLVLINNEMKFFLPFCSEVLFLVPHKLKFVFSGIVCDGNLWSFWLKNDRQIYCFLGEWSCGWRWNEDFWNESLFEGVLSIKNKTCWPKALLVFFWWNKC